MQRQFGNDYDVTGTVRVSDPDVVAEAVGEIFAQVHPRASRVHLDNAFRHFQRLFHGELPGFKGCDTVYHDVQHTLDMTLAMARLMAGYERTVPAPQCLGPELTTMGLIAALFHDSGYIQQHDSEVHNGAEYTQTHVSRSEKLLFDFFQSEGIGVGVNRRAAARVVHYTGLELKPDQISLPDPRLRILGELLGTADLVAQMADRCYLEKCRDRLFPEFVLGGVAFDDDGQPRYKDGTDLLRKTPDFYSATRNRLDEDLNRAYRYFEGWFDGENPYMEAVQKNLNFLDYVLKDERWSLLRRRPPTTESQEDHLESTHTLMVKRLRELYAREHDED